MSRAKGRSKQKPQPAAASRGRNKTAAPVRRTRSPWLLSAGIVFVGAALVVGVNLATRTPQSAGTVGAVGANVEVSLDLGQQLYDANCASCHGSTGGGYASRETPAPALDASEHAWHHADGQILGLIRNGGIQMPAVGASWSENDLASVLAYVKQWWMPEQLTAQQGTIGE